MIKWNVCLFLNIQTFAIWYFLRKYAPTFCFSFSLVAAIRLSLLFFRLYIYLFGRDELEINIYPLIVSETTSHRRLLFVSIFIFDDQLTADVSPTPCPHRCWRFLMMMSPVDFWITVCDCRNRCDDRYRDVIFLREKQGGLIAQFQA